METGMVFRTVFGKERWGSIFLMMPVKSLNAKTLTVKIKREFLSA